MKLGMLLAAVLLIGVVTPSSAWATHASQKCPGRYVVDRIETRNCPANNHRPAIVVKRACCRSPQGKIRCRHFPHCPRRSPSH